VDRENVRMLKVRGSANLPRESINAEGLRKLRAEDLDRDWPVMSQVAREVDGRRAPLTELALDAVAVLQRISKTGEDGVGQRFLHLRWGGSSA
jgi:hypothetical protein